MSGLGMMLRSPSVGGGTPGVRTEERDVLKRMFANYRVPLEAVVVVVVLVVIRWVLWVIGVEGMTMSPLASSIVAARGDRRARQLRRATSPGAGRAPQGRARRSTRRRSRPPPSSELLRKPNLRTGESRVDSTASTRRSRFRGRLFEGGL
jgi:hypothetical protein